MKLEKQRACGNAGQQVTRALIIDQPWIGKILRGEKVWEMRTTQTSIRGLIGLVEKGTGTIVGIARLVDSKGPLSFDEIFDNEPFHQVGPEVYSQPDYKWDHAWVLTDAMALPKPIPYKHKSGAVIWVELDEDAKKGIQRAFKSPGGGESFEYNLSSEGQRESSVSSDLEVPVARDGTHFCQRNCKRGSHYIVGEKGDEQYFSDYQSALSYLKQMPTAKWRRPNHAGNWGIVSAVRWENV